MDPLGFPCQLYSYKPNNQATKDISPATACALMLTHAYAGLWAPQFLEAGLLGLRENCLLGRKEGGGCFLMEDFFLLKTKMFVFFRGEGGMDIFFLEFVHLVTLLE